MGQSRVHVWLGWLLVAILIVGVNLAALRAALEPKWTWIPATAPGTSGTSIRQLPDGSVVKYIYPPTGGRIGPVVVQPTSAIGLWQVWWPVAASVGISLLVLGVARIAMRRLAVQAMGRTRIKTIHVMLVIGLISFGLWLIRFDLTWIISGAIVLMLMLLAGYRRALLAQEIEIGGRRAAAMSVAGRAGYSIAMLLAFAWIISVLFWDSFRVGRP